MNGAHVFRGARRGERTVAAAAKMRWSDNMPCSIAVLANQGAHQLGGWKRLETAALLGVAIDLRSGTFGICKQEQQDP